MLLIYKIPCFCILYFLLFLHLHFLLFTKYIFYFCIFPFHSFFSDLLILNYCIQFFYSSNSFYLEVLFYFYSQFYQLTIYRGIHPPKEKTHSNKKWVKKVDKVDKKFKCEKKYSHSPKDKKLEPK